MSKVECTSYRSEPTDPTEGPGRLVNEPPTSPLTATTSFHLFCLSPFPGFSQKEQISQVTISTVDSGMDHWPDSSLSPFSVEPSSGIVPVGKTQKIKVKFSPLDTGFFESNLVCQ